MHVKETSRTICRTSRCAILRDEYPAFHQIGLDAVGLYDQPFGGQKLWTLSSFLGDRIIENFGFGRTSLNLLITIVLRWVGHFNGIDSEHGVFNSTLALFRTTIVLILPNIIYTCTTFTSNIVESMRIDSIYVPKVSDDDQRRPQELFNLFDSLILNNGKLDDFDQVVVQGIPYS